MKRYIAASIAIVLIHSAAYAQYPEDDLPRTPIAAVAFVMKHQLWLHQYKIVVDDENTARLPDLPATITKLDNCRFRLSTPYALQATYDLSKLSGEYSSIPSPRNKAIDLVITGSGRGDSNCTQKTFDWSGDKVHTLCSANLEVRVRYPERSFNRVVRAMRFLQTESCPPQTPRF
jgi:hypothetical protein